MFAVSQAKHFWIWQRNSHKKYKEGYTFKIAPEVAGISVLRSEMQVKYRSTLMPLRLFEFK
jgi:hypothetical protein